MSHGVETGGNNRYLYLVSEAFIDNYTKNNIGIRINGIVNGGHGLVHFMHTQIIAT